MTFRQPTRHPLGRAVNRTLALSQDKDRFGLGRSSAPVLHATSHQGSEDITPSNWLPEVLAYQPPDRWAQGRLSSGLRCASLGSHLIPSLILQLMPFGTTGHPLEDPYGAPSSSLSVPQTKPHTQAVISPFHWQSSAQQSSERGKITATLSCLPPSQALLITVFYLNMK